MCTLCQSPADHDAKPAKPARKPRTPVDRAIPLLPGRAHKGSKGAKPLISHEEYVSRVVRAVLAVAPVKARAKLTQCKVVYGAGPAGTRGVTYYSAWQTGSAKQGEAGADAIALVAICATGQESTVQLCGTIVHELGHVLAGAGVGHKREWFDCCAILGLGGENCAPIQAAGTDYTWEMFSPILKEMLQAIPTPNDGAPAFAGALRMSGKALPPAKPRPCGMGYGVRGGQSRGTGSGSRMLKYVCKCERPQIVRHAGRDLAALCTRCNEPFTCDESSLPAAHTNGLGAAGLAKALASLNAPLPVTAPTAAPQTAPAPAPAGGDDWNSVPF